MAHCEVNPFIWADTFQVQLGFEPFSLVGHEYQLDVLNCGNNPNDVVGVRQCAKKGAQLGFTQVYVLDSLHGLGYGKYKYGVLYLFPTTKDVQVFTKTRFNPMISANPIIQSWVQETDSVDVKRVGTGYLYLRGARATKTIEGEKKSSSQLKSISVDRIVFDEVDEMDEDMVTLALHRMAHSRVKEEIYLSTPTVPNFGIDQLYGQSDQRIRMIKCQKCNHETCLEVDFPNCIGVRSDGTYFRKCMKCDAEIFPPHGRWVAQFPSKSKDLVGWWISQLNSMFVPLKMIMDAFENPPHGDLAEVYNSMLGMAYIASENHLTYDDIYNCAGANNDLMSTWHDGPCAMGVDVGKELHCVIGIRPAQRQLKVLNVGRCGTFEDLHDVAKRFNVKSMVIDLKPETHKVRDFQRINREFGVYLCDYQEFQRHGAAWNDKEKTVVVNRTEICDSSHDIVKSDGRLILPRRNSEIDEYAREMCNLVKVLAKDEDGKAKAYRYRPVGTKVDHYRHATNYFLLAADRIGVSSAHIMLRGLLGKSTRRTAMMA